MSAILNSLNAHNFLIFQQILVKLVSKFIVYRALSDKTYLLLGLRSPLIFQQWTVELCRKDSDGDGQTNGQELGDPHCRWTIGTQADRTAVVTHPGNRSRVLK